MITFRKMAVLAAALALGGTLLGAAPAHAQEAQDGTPWFMPQAWMYPQQTGPTGQRRISDYGSNLRYGRSYGSFANYCYGDCGPRGAIRSSQGAYLTRQVTVIFDSNAYAIVPRSSLIVEQPTYVQPSYSAPMAGGRSVQYSAAKPVAQKKKQLPQFSTENGVRIIRPKPTM